MSSSNAESNAGPKQKQPICVMRRYRTNDQVAVEKILGEAAMETVWDYFFSSIFSILMPQLGFFAFAVGFLVFHLPFYSCIALIPVMIVLLYVVIYMLHLLKAMEVKSDVHNIANTYLKGEKTNFWVAEVHENIVRDELSSQMGEISKVDYEFIREGDLDKRGDNLGEFKYHNVVACIAVTSNNSWPTRAWIQKFSVLKYYRRRHIAHNLLELLIEFSKEKQYSAVDLAVTDCQDKAQLLYHKAGFAATRCNRSFLAVVQERYVFSLTLKQKTDENNQEQNGNAVIKTTLEEELNLLDDKKPRTEKPTTKKDE